MQSAEQQERRRQDKLWRKRHRQQGRDMGQHDLSWEQIVLAAMAVTAILGFVAWRMRQLPPALVVTFLSLTNFSLPTSTGPSKYPPRI